MIRRLTLGLVLLVACSPDGPPPDEGAPADAVGASAALPSGPDLWLAPLLFDEDGATAGVGEATNVTRRAGYDNQPAFLPDGSAILYTSIDELGEADILRYDMAEGTSTTVTTTAPESEYSATPLSWAPGFTVIRVEADSTQRLWLLEPDGSDGQVLFPDLAPVGYHAWVDANTVVMFVLGDPPTLHIGNVETGESVVVANNVGRSIQPVPGTGGVSYTQRMGDGSTEIRLLDVGSGTSQRIESGVEGSDFHAWTPGGELLQAHDGLLYRWSGPGWAPIADFAREGLRLSRLAVSPDGRWLAFVAEPSEG